MHKSYAPLLWYFHGAFLVILELDRPSSHSLQISLVHSFIFTWTIPKSALLRDALYLTLCPCRLKERESVSTVIFPKCPQTGCELTLLWRQKPLYLSYCLSPGLFFMKGGVRSLTDCPSDKPAVELRLLLSAETWQQLYRAELIGGSCLGCLNVPRWSHGERRREVESGERYRWWWNLRERWRK